MSYETEYNQLKTRNEVLKRIISNENKPVDEQIIAKKELYLNKARMIDLIHSKDDSKRVGLTAREYKQRFKTKKKKPVYSCGIDKIDVHLDGGFETGQLINIAGESFAGKTELTMSLLANFSIAKKIAWFNFEMGEKNFVRRLDRVLTYDSQWDNFYIDEHSRNIDKMLQEMELLIEDGYFCFGIDSKMKIQGGAGKEDYQKYSNISTRLSEFAQTKDVLIFFINQMNEEDIKNHRLALKGSGDQKYDSDILLFMVIEEDKTNMKKIEDRKRFLVCTKNRQSEKTFSLEIGLNDYLVKSKEPVVIEFESVETKKDEIDYDDSSFDVSMFDVL